uniref:non-specific serine/threonine protein kinase n=1 Tax=Oryza punctata TaxID=4537 RepID=A0A0E0KV86_ORYPU
MALSVLLLLLATVAQAQKAPTTDPIEAAALNALFDKLNKKAAATWNTTGDPCSGAATDSTDINDSSINPAIKCDCSDQNNTVCHITGLKIYAMSAAGQIPEELRNLTRLTHLNLSKNLLTGGIPSFIGELTSMQYISFDINALSGPIPKELGNLTNLISLGFGSNNFNGSLPSELGSLFNLEQLYIDSAGLSGALPSSFSKLTRMKILWASDNNITGQIPDYIGGWNLTDLRFQGNYFHGPLPATLSNLVQLTNLILRNCRISDSLASIDFSKFSNLTLLDLSFNNITGIVPQTLLNLNSLSYLDFSYNQLSGNFPSWATDKKLQLNLVANNFVIDRSNRCVHMDILSCLAFGTGVPSAKHNLFSWSSTFPFAVKCASPRSMTDSNNIFYQTDYATLGPASYNVTKTSSPIWAVSNVGKFMDASNGNYMIFSGSQSQNTLASELFQSARMSPSSLRYYGIGLENGNYNVTLQFAELGYADSQSWTGTGRRVFDIYVQGDRKEQNFDIRKAVGGKSNTAIKKDYVINVTKNIVEIHLFWAGKGTCCIPSQGYYGPSISALSVTPMDLMSDFTPGARNAAQKKSSSKKGVIVGVVIGVTVLGLVALAAIFMCMQKRRKLSLEQQELYSIVGRPNVFSYGELRSGTENFSSSNLLGEGGYGAVYKGKLIDGRVVAVKQLSQSSHQGKRQFATEIETISRVQHRNLVKLYGCCLEGNNPLLVYEYMENGSLDKALFGSRRLNLDWATRFEIFLGIARGLAYLHEESRIRVVHRDIKASNVLLDTNLNPKISDFGLAKLYDDKTTHVSTKVAGTFGYLAPEYAMRGHMTEKVDVFAFGVVLLETLAGRPNYDDTLEEDKIYIFEWVWGLYENDHALDIVDPNLAEFNSEEVLRVIHVALLCTQGSPHRRPSMSRVVAMLTGDAEVGEVAAKPSYITEWQIKGGGTTITGSSSTSSSAANGQWSSAPPPPPPRATSSPKMSSPFLSSVVDEGSGGSLVPGRPIGSVRTIGRLRSSQPLAHNFRFAAAALNAVFAKLGQQAASSSSPSAWNISGDPCTGAATDDTDFFDFSFNPAIKCDCSGRNNTVCHITRLKMYSLDASGLIPEELRNLTRLTHLNLSQNLLTGPIPSFIGELTAMQYMGFGSNNFSGSLPSELGNLDKLEQLYRIRGREKGEVDEVQVEAKVIGDSAPYMALSVLLLLLATVAQAQKAPKTDPVEAAALNAVFAKLGQQAASSSSPSAWNISGDPCTGAATDDTDFFDFSFNPAIKCDCSGRNNTVCHITRLKMYSLDASGLIPEELRNLTRLTHLNLSQNLLTGPIPSFIGELTAMQYILTFFSTEHARTFGTNALSGSIPRELGSLTNLISLGFGSNNFSGSLPSELGNLDKLEQLYIDSAGLNGPLPASLSNLKRMKTLWASDNDFTGHIPDYIGSWNLTELRIGDIANGSSSSLSFISNLTSLSTLDVSYNQLSGDFPYWFTDTTLELNLVENNFGVDRSNDSNVSSTGLVCLQQNMVCSLGFPQPTSFAVNCGSNRVILGSDDYWYQADDANLGAASYYVAGLTWGVSNIGKFMDAPHGSYIIYSSRQFQNTRDSVLFQTSRMSPSSLRYYGIGLANGNYTVTLQFAEIGIEDTQSWKSLGRRVFDIYVQGERKEKDFDIRKEAGGKSYTAVKKDYTVSVTKNFVEIHLFWAGKGTCCIPSQGYYGPTISALSLTPKQNKSTNSKTGVIVGVVVGVTILGLVVLVGIIMWRQKRRKLSLERQELYSIVGRPNVFSYGELRSSTENFSSSNLLGEGGYGAVYKGKLTDGRLVAVKQLSQTSHQGKKQFATEIETISRVQHRNLVKLYGCCLEGNNPLLVYEYMENGSIARGLAYLHEDSSIRVVHMDIKASNILLDVNLIPKISDFGLAKLYDDKMTHVSTKVAGTFGYLAPEYAMRGRMTEKVDVFAFGVVLFETIAGRPNYDDALEEDKIYIFEWVWGLYESDHALDIVDPNLTEFNSE